MTKSLRRPTGSFPLPLEPVVLRREITEDGSLEEGKQAILKVCLAEPVEPDWSGTLTLDNVEQVAERIRLTLEDKTFAVAEMLCVGELGGRLRLDTDHFMLQGEWTDGSKDKIRVMRSADAGRASVYIGFNTPTTFWIMNCAPTDDHENYRYPYISFKDSGTLMSFRQRAPDGCLHWRQFKVQSSPFYQPVYGGIYGNE